MPNVISLPVDTIDVQLTNNLITTPVAVVFRRDSVLIHLETESTFAQVSVQMRGSKIVALIRISETQPQIIELIDLSAGA